MTAGTRQQAQHRTRGHGVARVHRSLHRLVGRAEPARMVDRHDTTAGDPAGEGHHPGCCREHAGRRGRRQVDAAVTGRVGAGGGDERRDHPRPAVEGQPPAGGVRGCRRRRRRQHGQGPVGDRDEAQQAQQAHQPRCAPGAGAVGDVHGLEPGRCGQPGGRPRRFCGRPTPVAVPGDDTRGVQRRPWLPVADSAAQAVRRTLLGATRLGGSTSHARIRHRASPRGVAHRREHAHRSTRLATRDGGERASGRQGRGRPTGPPPGTDARHRTPA